MEQFSTLIQTPEDAAILEAALKNPAEITLDDPFESDQLMAKYESAKRIVIKNCQFKSMHCLLQLKQIEHIMIYYKEHVMVNLWELGYIKNLKSFAIFCKRLPIEAVTDLVEARPKEIALAAENAKEFKELLVDGFIHANVPVPNIRVFNK
jgi:hypothetical protein